MQSDHLTHSEIERKAKYLFSRLPQKHVAKDNYAENNSHVFFLPSSQEKSKQERASARKIAEFHLVDTLGTRRVSRAHNHARTQYLTFSYYYGAT